MIEQNTSFEASGVGGPSPTQSIRPAENDLLPRFRPLWHVGHQNEAGLDGVTLHFDEGGSLHIDEQDGDDVKLLGIYSTEQKAEERIPRARLLPGSATNRNAS
ncbi:hypothetical protein ACFYXS_23665 [Streptomyces sp. NPDC002574]|uniref:hypothetical protein n=1 Tax=Streptomyces sp. NPDC002574 TaxID=3364652 RepID=UPI003684E42E